jgi:uncharacterized UBP type Zn finger protein
VTNEKVAQSEPDRPPPPSGFYNDGNGCYYISALQLILRCCPKLIVALQELADGSWMGGKRIKLSLLVIELHNRIIVGGGDGTELAQEIRKHLTSNSKDSALLAPNSDGSERQHDAHEFIFAFLGCLNDEFKLESGVPPEALQKDVSHTPIDALFGFCMLKEIHCVECDCCHTTSEKCLDMPLELNRCIGTIQHLGELSRRAVYSQGELGNYQCDFCGKFGTSTKTTQITNLPEYVLMHIQRFQQLPEGSPFAKKNNVSLKHHVLVHYAEIKISSHTTIVFLS